LAAMQAQLAEHEEARRGYERAIDAYDRALALAPDYVLARGGRAQARLSLGDRLLEANEPDNARARWTLALVDVQRGRKIAPGDERFAELERELRRRLGE